MKEKLGVTSKIIIICVIWYGSSAGTNITAKNILGKLPYPMTVSMIHMLIMMCFLTPTLSYLDIAPAPHFSKNFYVKRIVPLAVGKLLGAISSHFSIWKVPVSYSHTVKAMMPLFTVLLTAVIFKESHSWKIYLSLLPIVGGVIMATVTELSFDLSGMMAALFATMCFALQNIYSKKSMREIHIHHLRLLLVLTQTAIVLLFPLWMYADVWNIITSLHKVQNIWWFVLLLPLSGFFSYLQNVMAFSMISLVSPVSYSVANVSKRIVIISTSLLLLRNPVTISNVCGMGIAILGVAIYNKVKQGATTRHKPLLPTTDQDQPVNGHVVI